MPAEQALQTRLDPTVPFKKEVMGSNPIGATRSCAPWYRELFPAIVRDINASARASVYPVSRENDPRPPAPIGAHAGIPDKVRIGRDAASRTRGGVPIREARHR